MALGKRKRERQLDAFVAQGNRIFLTGEKYRSE